MDIIETVYQAVALLNSNDSTACKKASDWLGEFQKSKYAWDVCNRMLEAQRDWTSCYFAAQTMRQSVLSNLHTLGTVHPSTSLGDSIITHLNKFASSSLDSRDVIITQLCLALADLYLQVPEWNNFLGKILEVFSSPDKYGVLMTLLKSLSEEVQSRHLRVGENRRQAVNGELACITQAVIYFLSQVFASNENEPDNLKRVLNCFGSWLLNPLIPTDEIAQSELLSCVFKILQATNVPGSLHDAACECMVAALYRAANINTNKTLAVALQNACFNMVDSFKLAVTTDDFEKLQGYSRVFCELNESFIECMIDTPNSGFGDFRMLDLLLLLAEYHDYSLVEVTFNIWYRLSEYLYDKNDYDLSAKFSPYIERYIMALYKHCRFDSDQETVPDDNDDFVEFRCQVSDTIKDVVFIVGTDRCVQSMISVLQTAKPGSWDEFEAALYIISIVVHNVLPTDEDILPYLLQSILNMPPTSHPLLVCTSIQLVGNLVDWLFQHERYRDPCIKWLLDKMQNPVHVKVASEALENICIKCESRLIQYFDSIFSTASLLETSTSKGQQVETAILALLRACSSLLNGLHGDDISTHLRLLVQPQVERLDLLLKANAASATAETQENENTGDAWSRLSTDPVLWIDRLAAVFRHVHPYDQDSSRGNRSQNGGKPEENAPSSWLDVIRSAWPVVSNACKCFEKSTRVVEHCCRTMRFMIRSLGTESVVFIEPLVQQMLDIYGRHPHSCFLYLASILVDEYGHSDTYRAGLTEMLKMFCVESFKLLQMPNGFRDHPDTIDDLFRLGIRFIQRAPSAFFKEAVSVQLFECALIGLEVDHVDASRSVTKFLNECVESVLLARKEDYRDDSVNNAENLLRDCGQRLIGRSLRAAIFFVSGSLKRDMAELLYNVKKLSKEQFSVWLKAVLAEFPQNGGLCATPDQLADFHRNFVEASSLQRMYSQLRDLLQLYS